MNNDTQTWITPANPKYYRVEEAYAHLKEIDWTLGASPNLGDIVYIYISGGNGHVAFKTEVTRTNVPINEVIEDKDFVVETQERDPTKPLTRLKLIAKATHKKLTYEALRFMGLNSTLQTTQRLPVKCFKYIEKYFDSPMLNLDRFAEVKKEYLRCFKNWWPNERYKLKALSTFKEYWDIEASDFKSMWEKATEDCGNLLASSMFYPRAVIRDCINQDSETVRNLFRNLYDEELELESRVNDFINGISELYSKVPNHGKNNYQTTNSVSTYLWLKYSEKYYIYKSGVLSQASNFLGFDGNTNASLTEGFRYFDLLHEELVNDEDILSTYTDQIKEDRLHDPGFHTLAIDFDYFLGRCYLSYNKQYWIFAPGENANNWQRDLDNGEMSMGWDELEDLKQYQTKGALQQAMKDLGWKTKSANTILHFANDIRIGDIILARKGLNNIIGMGIVESDYEYNESKDEFCHIHKVNWTHCCDIDATPFFTDGRCQFSRDTLTNATNESYPRKIEKMLLNEIPLSTQRYTALLEENKNLILNGAPGTGKTRLAKNIAKQLNAEWEMVQFHPSYDYTDFVEGLRPITNDATGNVGFTRMDGAFKAFCKRALKNWDDSHKSQEQIQKEASIQEKIEDFLSECVSGEEEWTMGDGQEGTIFKSTQKSSGLELLSGNKFFITSYDDEHIHISSPENPKVKELTLSMADLKKVLEYDQEIHTVKEIKEILGQKYSTQQNSYIFILQREIRKLKNAVTLNKSEAIKLKKYVFIIDEINRGDLSKIFGELFFSIDRGYRGKDGLVQTQYNNLVEETDPFKDGFFVPENVYIIGTMNDIDRSVESMDFAMRRRFVFSEVTAEESAENFNLPENKKTVMKRLNDAIEKTQGLGKDYQIGAAYFKDKFNLEKLWNLSLEGLLREYLRGIDRDGQKFIALKNSYFAMDEENA